MLSLSSENFVLWDLHSSIQWAKVFSWVLRNSAIVLLKTSNVRELVEKELALADLSDEVKVEVEKDRVVIRETALGAIIREAPILMCKFTPYKDYMQLELQLSVENVRIVIFL